MSWGAVAGGAIVAGAGLLSSKMSADAAKSAANAQKEGTTAALQEEQRQFDLNMQEYRRKQAMLEQQQSQMIQQTAPYIQGGQSAFYQMLALNGLAAPTGFTPSPEISVGGKAPTAPTEPGRVGILGANRTPFGNIAKTVTQAVGQTAAGPQSTLPTVENAVNSYAGMTGEQAQQTAIQNIASSPLLQELTRQGEEAMLQQASATGGLRGGNTQAALAQFRPQMLQNEIDKQYARLSGLSGMGMQATGMNPMTNPGTMPSNPNIGQYYSDIGAINAGAAQARGQAAGQAIGSIVQGIGYGLNQYNNRQPQTTSNYSGGGGMQVIGYDNNGNPIMG